MAENRPPRLEELTPRDVVFCRTPPEGVRMDIAAGGAIAMRFQPRMNSLYCERPFARLPTEDSVAFHHAEDALEDGRIRLPVIRRDGKFFTSPDWALAALASVENGKSIVPRLPNIHAALRDAAVPPEALLIPHPHTGLTPWQALLVSDATDRQVLAVVRKAMAGDKAIWRSLAAQEDSLDMALIHCRPWVADTLWSRGARTLHVNAMFRAAVPLVDTLMERLGSTLAPKDSTLPLDSWPATRDGGRGWKGLSVEDALEKWGETWRPRVLAMMRESPPPKFSLTIGQEDARRSEDWSLQDFLVCWSSLLQVFAHARVSGSDNAYARLRTVIASQRVAWLDGLLAAGVPPPSQVQVPAWAQCDLDMPVAPLERILTAPSAARLFEPQEVAAVLGVMQRHAVAAAPAAQQGHRRRA